MPVDDSFMGRRIEIAEAGVLQVDGSPSRQECLAALETTCCSYRKR